MTRTHDGFDDRRRHEMTPSFAPRANRLSIEAERPSGVGDDPVSPAGSIEFSRGSSRGIVGNRRSGVRLTPPCGHPRPNSLEPLKK